MKLLAAPRISVPPTATVTPPEPVIGATTLVDPVSAKTTVPLSTRVPDMAATSPRKTRVPAVRSTPPLELTAPEMTVASVGRCWMTASPAPLRAPQTVALA